MKDNLTSKHKFPCSCKYSHKDKLKTILTSRKSDKRYPQRYDGRVRVWCGKEKGVWYANYSRIKVLLEKYGNVTVEKALQKEEEEKYYRADDGSLRRRQ